MAPGLSLHAVGHAVLCRCFGKRLGLLMMPSRSKDVCIMKPAARQEHLELEVPPCSE